MSFLRAIKKITIFCNLIFVSKNVLMLSRFDSHACLISLEPSGFCWGEKVKIGVKRWEIRSPPRYEPIDGKEQRG